MEREAKIECLRKTRGRLLRAYFVHVGWLTSTCAFAATDSMDVTITASLWLVLLTVPPVLIYAVSVHKACRAIDPTSRTFGWVPIILATIFLTPFESALVLPARNLWVSRCILRGCEKSSQHPRSHAKPARALKDKRQRD
jgi:hypothetical protein